MGTELERTELLLGRAAMERLARARVAVFGLGGVGALDLVDHDVFSESNLNRQILATRETIGRDKARVAAERVLAIRPDCRVRVHNCFYLPETTADFDFHDYDYVIDAIDTVSGKLQLVLAARAAGTPICCAMGTGNKLDPTQLRVGDLFETKEDPLARVMRRELRRRGVEHLTVVWSPETPRETYTEEQKPDGRRSIPGSAIFVPAAAGLLLARQVVLDLTAGL